VLIEQKSKELTGTVANICPVSIDQVFCQLVQTEEVIAGTGDPHWFEA
jgi:hypothetical protein